MAVDETARALEFLRDARSCTSCTGGVGVRAGLSLGRFDLPKMGIIEVDDQISSIVGSTSRSALIRKEKSHGHFSCALGFCVCVAIRYMYT